MFIEVKRCDDHNLHEQESPSLQFRRTPGRGDKGGGDFASGITGGVVKARPSSGFGAGSRARPMEAELSSRFRIPRVDDPSCPRRLLLEQRRCRLVFDGTKPIPRRLAFDACPTEEENENRRLSVSEEHCRRRCLFRC